MNAIITLENVYGYVFYVDGEYIRYIGSTASIPDKQAVASLLREVQSRRAEAIAFLTHREHPMDLPRHLWSAAEKAERSVHAALAKNNHPLARKELQRTVRLCAAAAQASGAVDPHIPWVEWVSSFSEVTELGAAR